MVTEDRVWRSGPGSCYLPCCGGTAFTRKDVPTASLSEPKPRDVNNNQKAIEGEDIEGDGTRKKKNKDDSEEGNKKAKLPKDKKDK